MLQQTSEREPEKKVEIIFHLERGGGGNFFQGAAGRRRKNEERREKAELFPSPLNSAWTPFLSCVSSLMWSICFARKHEMIANLQLKVPFAFLQNSGSMKNLWHKKGKERSHRSVSMSLLTAAENRALQKHVFRALLCLITPLDCVMWTAVRWASLDSSRPYLKHHTFKESQIFLLMFWST